jgi:hypothetical protein
MCFEMQWKEHNLVMVTKKVLYAGGLVAAETQLERVLQMLVVRTVK